MVANVHEREVCGGVMPDKNTKFSFFIVVPGMNLAGMVDYFFN